MPNGKRRRLAKLISVPAGIWKTAFVIRLDSSTQATHHQKEAQTFD
jgi:hypothetical protein